MTAAGRLDRSRSPLSGKPLCQEMQLALSTLSFILCKNSIYIGIYKVNIQLFLVYRGKIFTPSLAYALSALANASSIDTPVAKITPKRR